MAKRRRYCIGGIDLSSGPEPDDDRQFVWPDGGPFAYLLDGHAVEQFVEALRAVGYPPEHLPGSNDNTDADLTYDHARTALAWMRRLESLSTEAIEALSVIVESWSLIPHSCIWLWWNRPPYPFDKPMTVVETEFSPPTVR